MQIKKHQANWLGGMCNFNFEMQHWPGRFKVVADALLRATVDAPDDVGRIVQQDDLQTTRQLRKTTSKQLNED